MDLLLGNRTTFPCEARGDGSGYCRHCGRTLSGWGAHPFPFFEVRSVKRLILIAVVLVVLLVGAFVAIFMRAEAMRKVQGYSNADTPQEAADMFKKAIQNRDYEYAADYTTPAYAEQMKRGGDAGKEFAVALDNLIYQMNERSLIRDETKLVFASLDPFPKDFTIVLAKVTEETAEATITFAAPVLRGKEPNSGEWKLRSEMFNVFLTSLRFKNPSTCVVGMKKDAKGWKFDFPSDAALQLRVGHMNEKYKNYVNPFEMVTQEVKNDPNTKENATARLKELLEGAAKE